MANLIVLPNPATRYICLEADRRDGKYHLEDARKCIEDQAGYVSCPYNPNNTRVCANYYPETIPWGVN